jgi:hypothetical protein
MFVKRLYPFSVADLIIEGFASGTYAITSFVVAVLVLFNCVVRPFPPPLLTCITVSFNSISKSVTIRPLESLTILLISVTLPGIASSILFAKSPTRGSSDCQIILSAPLPVIVGT